MPEYIPTLTVGRSQGQINDQGYTYNEASLSYNQTAETYGGVYNYTSVAPTIAKASQFSPRTMVLPTFAQLQNNSTTYNQTNLSYNQTSYSYEGVYGFQDAVPIISLARDPKPTVAYFSDLYTTRGTSTGQNTPYGPGFFLFITQP